MKRLLYLLFALLAGTTGARAQCVIYGCTSTGAWGVGYNEAKVVTMKECDATALDKCKTGGGKECRLLSKSTKTGWWAVIATRKANSPAIFDIAEAQPTREAAEAEAKKKYLAHGGTNPKVKISSWQVFGNHN